MEGIGLETIQALIDAANNGGWAIVIGIALMITVQVLKKTISPLVSKRDTDLFAAFLGVLTCIGVSLYSGGDPIHAVLSGVLVGATAVGFWEILGKRIKDLYGRGTDVSGGGDKPSS